MSYQNYRPLSFGEIPFVTKNLIIINVLLFVFTNYVIRTVDFNAYLDLHTINTGGFKPHQFVTHMFMHASISHLAFNMFGLYLFGSKLESLWKSKRYINFYLVCGLAAAAVQFAVYYYTNQPAVMLGASGAIAGLMGATGYLFPNSDISLFMFPPIKYKYFVPLYFVASWYRGYMAAPGDNTAHFAHIGGLVAGIIIVFIRNKTNKQDFY
jgi:membrane associated rhomboid family serine protease